MWIGTTAQGATRGSPDHRWRCREAFDFEFDGDMDVTDFGGDKDRGPSTFLGTKRQRYSTTDDAFLPGQFLKYKKRRQRVSGV